MKNGYPKIVVEGTIAGVIDKQGISKAPVIDVPKLKVFMKLPYIGPESLKLKKQILTLFRNTFNSAELSIVFKAGSTIGQMFPFKDRVPQLMRSFVIYKITCDACGASYIGKTTQLLNARLTRELSGRENSAAFAHTEKFGENHSFDKHKATILGTERHDLPLKIKESLLITHLDPILNRSQTSERLYLF